MGFSTSGAVLVILIGFLIAVSALVPTLFTVTTTTGEAFAMQNDHLRDQNNMEITIESFRMVINGTTNEIVEPPTLTVVNDGASSLSVAETDLVINGEYEPIQGGHPETTILAGGDERPTSDVWPPGTRLEVDIDEDRLDQSDADRIRVVTERGIADAASLTVEER